MSCCHAIKFLHWCAFVLMSRAVRCLSTKSWNAGEATESKGVVRGKKITLVKSLNTSLTSFHGSPHSIATGIYDNTWRSKPSEICDHEDLHTLVLLVPRTLLLRIQIDT